MTDNKNLIAEIKRKQAEIAKDIEAMIEQGGANLPELEWLKTKHDALAGYFEAMRRKHSELQSELEGLFNKTEGGAK